MRIFGRIIFPRQIILLASSLVFFGATSYDVHRSIKANENPPSEEQIRALKEFIDSKRSRD